MIIKKKEPGNFTPHPETENLVHAVVVDITPLKLGTQKKFKSDEEYEVMKFRIVYESEVTDSEGKRFCIWSRPYVAGTPDPKDKTQLDPNGNKDPLNEKSHLRKDIKSILGRDLTAKELDGFDIEATLLGKVVRIMVEHEEEDGKVYDRITHIKACSDDFKPSGSYVRIKDREKNGDGKDASYQKASAPKTAPAASAPSGATTPAPAAADTVDTGDDWTTTKVHIDGYNGLPLCDLDAETTIPKLVNEELPKLEAKKLKSKADQRLITALKKAKEELGL